MLRDPDCDFCAIVAGDAEAEIVCSGDTWLAFFPINPATPGHTLVVPKAHFRDLWDVQDQSLARDLMAAAIYVGHAVRSAVKPEGMNLVTSAGTSAEQSVFHLHLHVVPRWDQDGFGDIWPRGERYNINDLGNVAELVRSFCEPL